MDRSSYKLAIFNSLFFHCLILYIVHYYYFAIDAVSAVLLAAIG